MRRGRAMGRGGGMGRMNMTSGPLLTEHLKDIDLELELLKRKREMIEQQHSLLQPVKKQSQRNYNQQSYEYNDNGGQSSSSNCDFSHLYNDGPQNYRKPPPFVKKRPSDTVWDDDPFPKRSTGHGQHSHDYHGPFPTQKQRSFTTNPSKRDLPTRPGRGRPHIGQRISNQKQHIPERNFVPNKITKPTKTFAPPHNIASQSVGERNNLVAVALKSVAESVVRDQEASRLLPNKEPTRQMTGRMEMALGAILRDIRELYEGSDYAETLRTFPLQRVIKQNIRDRVRTAMLGKVVGPAVEVVKEYRDMFPKETDQEIINQALKAVGFEPGKQPAEKPPNQPSSPIVTEKESEPKIERPDIFFKSNMFKLLNSHLSEMFTKLEDIYISQDKQENSVSGNATTTVTNAAKGANADDTTPTKATEAADAAAATNPQAADTIATRKSQLDAIMAEGEKAAANLGILNSTDYKRMLPRLLKRHIPAIIKLLNINKMYNEAVSDLFKKTRDIYVEYGKDEVKDETVQQSEAKNITPGAQSTPKKTQYPLPYYVKVMGKPQLPKKKVMQPFLEAFHPKSIKKHRTIHNLLFIGFTEKSNFEALVDANGTVVGRSTLSVRVCEKVNEKQEDMDMSNKTTVDISNNDTMDISNKATTDMSNKDSMDTDMSNKDTMDTETFNKDTMDINKDTSDQKSLNEDILGAELDDQISDLLSTIKQSEEDSSDIMEEIQFNIKNQTTGDEHVKDIPTEKKYDMITEDNENTVQSTKPNETQNDKRTRPENENLESDKPEVVNSEPNNTETENKEDNLEKCDQISELKNAATGRSTPTRASSRLANASATPGSIRTRRSSKLAQN